MDVKVRKENLIESSLDNIRKHYSFESTTLGEGTYGFVRVCVRLTDSARFAVKIIPKKRIKNPEVLNSEILVMKQVDHPNIVKLYETYEDPRYVYLVMELCEGGELFDKLIEMGHFSEKLGAVLFSQMASAVAYLHSRNIAHRDLKPENFLFGVDSDFNSLKLIDFGLAKTVSSSSTLTTKTGTCYYVSPETLKGNYNEKCDVWSLGVILFMLLSGYPPFDGETDREILDSVRRCTYSFGESVWNNVSEYAKDLISKMFTVNPDERISSEMVLNHPWLQIGEEPESPVKIEFRQLESYQSSHHLRKTVLNFMASQCSTNELQDIIKTFKKIDANHDGTLSLAEIRNVLETVDIAERENIERVISSIDADQSGTIDLTEFVAAMLDKRIYMNEEKLLQAFNRFDIDHSGYISPDELRKVLGEDNVSDPVIWNEMISAVDLDGDGLISFDEFVKMMDRANSEELQAIRRSIDG